MIQKKQVTANQLMKMNGQDVGWIDKTRELFIKTDKFPGNVVGATAYDTNGNAGGIVCHIQTETERYDEGIIIIGKFMFRIEDIILTIIYEGDGENGD